MRRRNPITIPENEKILLVELSDDLFTHLLESNALSDPTEAQVIAAAFLVEQYEKGWRFTKCEEKAQEEQQKKPQ